MTEAEIKRVVERRMDRLDLLLLDGALDQDHYQDAVADLTEWAERELRRPNLGR